MCLRLTECGFLNGQKHWSWLSWLNDSLHVKEETPKCYDTLVCKYSWLSPCRMHTNKYGNSFKETQQMKSVWISQRQKAGHSRVIWVLMRVQTSKRKEKIDDFLLYSVKEWPQSWKRLFRKHWINLSKRWKLGRKAMSQTVVWAYDYKLQPKDGSFQNNDQRLTVRRMRHETKKNVRICQIVSAMKLEWKK